MKHINKMAGIGLGSLFVLGAVGCGGGGGGDEGGDGSGGAAEGAYYGTADASTGSRLDVFGVVLDDGDYWFIYAGDGVFGGVQGTGDAGSDGSFTSSNGRDFAVGDDVLDVDVDAQAVARSTLNGTLRYEGGDSVGFSLFYDDLYELTPTLAALAGSYGGTAVTSDGQDQVSVTVSSSGAISGGSAVYDCRFSGTATPRSSGNVYDLRVSFSGDECTHGSATLRGIAFYDVEVNQLFTAAVNDDRSDGFIFVGQR